MQSLQNFTQIFDKFLNSDAWFTVHQWKTQSRPEANSPILKQEVIFKLGDGRKCLMDVLMYRPKQEEIEGSWVYTPSNVYI